MTSDANLIEMHLMALLNEIQQQFDVARCFPPEILGFEGQTEQIREWIEDAGEYGLAYESMVSLLEDFPFRLSGAAAVKLLEVGLLLRYKSELSKDQRFDLRELAKNECGDAT